MSKEENKMHEFKLTIKLDNKDYCNGCKAHIPEWEWCMFLGLKIEKRNNIHDETEFVRPDICKESEETK